jgi:hypothetical protein
MGRIKKYFEKNLYEEEKMMKEVEIKYVNGILKM